MERGRLGMVKLGPGGMLLVAFFATALALVFLLAVPARAQDDSQATDLAGETAEITESTTDDDEIVDRIVVPAAGCEVDPDASVVVEDDDGTRARLSDGDNVDITADANRVTIVGTGPGGNLGSITAGGQFGTVDETVNGEVVSSTGIRCGRDDAADDEAGGDGDAGNGDEAGDDLENLDCDELLVLFRGEGQGQYEDGGSAVDLNDSEVRAEIEVCLKKEIVNEPEGKLPKTGGVSLLALAVLGVVSAAAGLSVIRGGRRQG